MTDRFRQVERVQEDRIINDCVKEFTSLMKRDIRNTSTLQEITDSVKNVTGEIKRKFFKCASQTLCDYNEEEFQKSDTSERFNLKISHVSVEFIRNQVDVVYHKMITDNKKSLATFMANVFKNLKPGWWTEFKETYNKRLQSVCDTIDKLGEGNEDLATIFTEELNAEKKREFFLTIHEKLLI